MPFRLLDAATPAESGRAEQFLALVAEPLEATDRLFRDCLASDVPFIDQCGEYIFAGGGKRMRPALLLLCAQLLGRDGEEEVTYAAVVELIHTATLIHDDVIDHAALRRGRRTINELWGNNQTVLLGDWLYTKAMKMALAHGSVEVIDRLCEATLRMTEGELLTQQRLGARDLSVDEYFRIIDRKTAQLFAAACSVPARHRPARPEAIEPLERYGRALGVCFQLADDLLDYTATAATVGKPVLSDLKEGKLTLPLLLALPRLRAEERAKVEMVIEDRSFTRVEASEILELVQREGTIGEVELQAQALADEARKALATFPDSETRRALEFAPDFVLHRRA
ncbi:MAG: polyprenyl synthetase family protein [Thermoanaerobaculia bacterium]